MKTPEVFQEERQKYTRFFEEGDEFFDEDDENHLVGFSSSSAKASCAFRLSENIEHKGNHRNLQKQTAKHERTRTGMDN